MQHNSSSENIYEVHKDNSKNFSKNSSAVANKSLLDECLPTSKELITDVTETYVCDENESNIHRKLSLSPKNSLLEHQEPVDTSVFISKYEKRKLGRPRKTKVQIKVNTREAVNERDLSSEKDIMNPEMCVNGKVKRKPGRPRKAMTKIGVNAKGTANKRDLSSEKYDMNKRKRRRLRKTNAQLEIDARETSNKRYLASGKDDTDHEVCVDEDEIQIIGEYEHLPHRRPSRSHLFNWLQKNHLHFAFKSFGQQVLRGRNHVTSKKFHNKTPSFIREESTNSEKNLQHKHKLILATEKCQEKSLQNGLSNSGLPKTANRILTISPIFKKGIVPSEPSFSKPRLNLLADKGIDSHNFIKKIVEEPQNSVSHGLIKEASAIKSQTMEQAKQKPGENPVSVSENKLNYKLNSGNNIIQKRNILPPKSKMVRPMKINMGNNHGKDLFVVTPDGTMVQIEKTHRKVAVQEATVKMKVINQSIKKIEEMDAAKLSADMEYFKNHLSSVSKFQNRSQFKKKTKKSLDLVNCVAGFPGEIAPYGSKILPDVIQLVESKLPLKEAVNFQELCGTYLFTQIFNSCNSSIVCHLCDNYKTLKPKMLSEHYRNFHQMSVKNEKSVLNSKEVTNFSVCGINFDTPAAMRVHCNSECIVHQKTEKFSVTDIERFMYCSLCHYPSVNLNTHLWHMQNIHHMYTHKCPYCIFCRSKQYIVLNHIKAVHEFPSKEDLRWVICTICSLLVNKNRFKQHVMMTHAVQTGPITWSCSKCFYPYHRLDLLTSHVLECPKLEENSIDEECPDRVLYNCGECHSRFSNMELLNEHMSIVHSQEVSSNLQQKDRDDQSQNKCNLCFITFPTSEMCESHQHHVHMVWVNNRAFDYSGVTDIINAKSKQNIQSSESLPCPKKTDSKLHLPEKFDLKIIPLGNGYIFSQETIKTPERQEVKKESDASKRYKQLTGFDICLDDLPDGKKLVELGFSKKVGYFCETCYLLIKSYPLYYLHMLNFHHFVKRFRCVVSSCAKTFSQISSFQKHTLHHNQTMFYSCTVCDLVFSDYNDLQDHLPSFDHCHKYVQIVKKYNPVYPHNHRCKICDRFFGLSSTFLKHMEFDNHMHKCPICDSMFKQPISRRNHIETKHPEAANTCDVCGKDLKTSKSLWEHLASHSIVYECEKCLKKFLNEEFYDGHVTSVHGSPIFCSWAGCNKQFSTAIDLYYHLKNHKSKSNTKCPECHKDMEEELLNGHLKMYHPSFYKMAGNLEPYSEENQKLTLDLQFKKSSKNHSIDSDPQDVLTSVVTTPVVMPTPVVVTTPVVVLSAVVVPTPVALAIPKDVQLKESLLSHSIVSSPVVVPTPEECRNGVLMKASPIQPYMNQDNKTIKLEPVDEPIDSIPEEMIQYACAGCMSIFQTKSLFEAHVCTGNMMQG